MKAMRQRCFSLTAGLLLAALVAACHLSAAKGGDEVTQAALGGGQWLLTEIAGQKIKTNAERPAYLAFGEGNRMSGSGGCNRLAGEYRLTSGRIHFSRMISTKMACLDMRTEDALLAALPTVASCSLSESGDVLTLYNDDGVVVAVLRRDYSSR